MLDDDDYIEGRITPARAGKTGISRKIIRAYRDHPRSCGKDEAKKFESNISVGSPPLVRERQKGANGRDAVSRITPARAGKT